MRRRTFVTLIGGAAAWPLAAHAQDAKPARLVGVLMATAVDEDQQVGLDAFLQALKQLGWVEGRNIRFDIRWGQARATETGRHTAELAALAPDIIFADGTAALQSLLRETRTIPIVFCNIKRSIEIDGHKTSVSLEDAFWSDLKEIAHARQETLSKLVAKIDETRRRGNLSSAIRLFVLEYSRAHTE